MTLLPYLCVVCFHPCLIHAWFQVLCCVTLVPTFFCPMTLVLERCLPDAQTSALSCEHWLWSCYLKKNPPIFFWPTNKFGRTYLTIPNSSAKMGGFPNRSKDSGGFPGNGLEILGAPYFMSICLSISIDKMIHMPIPSSHSGVQGTNLS